MRVRPSVLLLLASLLPGACGEPAPPPAPDASVALRTELERRLSSETDPAARVGLEIELATVAVQTTRAKADWAPNVAAAVTELTALREAKQAAGDAAAEARVRVALGKHLSMAGRFAEADAELDWVVANAPQSPDAPAAVSEKASNLWRRHDYAGCKALLERLLAEYPASPEAARAPAGIESCDRELAR